jgi:hypothetical protein
VDDILLQSGFLYLSLTDTPFSRFSQYDMRYFVAYTIVLYCIVLYCIVLYCIVLYCIVLYCIVLYCIVLYCIVLYCILESLKLIEEGRNNTVMESMV